MNYLLDVNALVALGFGAHEFHDRVSEWVAALDAGDCVLTCPITEIGFVRVLNQVPQYQVAISDGRALLARLRASRKRQVHFLSDNHGAEQLPQWVKSGRQTTDGHLAELAKSAGARLATLGAGVPGALLIRSPRAET
jgi:predicted nucleic acid-binding protein